MTDLIEGSSVGVKTMADGTLRLTVDIEPSNATAAFALFGSPGRAMVLAALKDGSGAIGVDRVETEQIKGGEWAKLAGMWCRDADFYEWIAPIYDRSCGGKGFGYGPFPVPQNKLQIEKFCSYALKSLALLGSRKDMDYGDDALTRFNVHIRWPFMAWMKEKGIKK